ncbi:MAG: glycosyltransferase [Candidatus Saccharimonadales bacterium]
MTTQENSGQMALGQFEIAAALANNQADNIDRSHEIFRLQRNPETFEVTVESDVTLEDYRAGTDPELWGLVEDFVKPIEGQTVVFINPTMEGGGVAIMRPALIHMLKKLGVDARWFVMKGKDNPADPTEPDPFTYTKLMHIISHRQGGDARIDKAGKNLHHTWAVERNGAVLLQQDAVLNADFIVIDDPQPAPLIRPIMQANPKAKMVWRNHIDTHHGLMSDPTTPQGEVASYLLDECGVRDVHAVVAHPVDLFLHPGMEDKTFFAPATIDPFDNLNRHLNEKEVAEGIDFINGEITSYNATMMAEGRTADVVQLLDTEPSRKRITLVARFDEAKGMDKAMEMGYLVRQKLRASGVSEAELPEVVIVGNGSVDDPSGPMMFERMLKIRRERFADDADGIILMRLKHNYDVMNALVSRSTIMMQTSDAEGLETRVSDAIAHGKPIVISNRGGMKTQVIEGQSGIILDYDAPGHDLERGADWMVELLADDEKYQSMVASTIEAARFHNLREFTTVSNSIRWLRVFGHLLAGREADKVWLLRDLLAHKQASQVTMGQLSLN